MIVLLVKVIATSRSFQRKKNCTIATVTIELRAMGKPMDMNDRRMLAPSMVEASNISLGMARKYVAIMNTVSGRPVPT